MPDRPRPSAVVLAAGQGTRMRSATPKVMHRLGGRTMLAHALAAVDALDPAAVVVVVRHERDRVADHVSAVRPGALVADQDEVPGTGWAFACGLAALDAAAAAPDGPGQDAVPSVPTPDAGPGRRVLVTYGDVPLLRPQTLRTLLDAAPDAAVTMLTAVVDDPTGYGRIVRDAEGGVARIVEERDADAETRSIREVNSGVYALDASFARRAVQMLRPSNAAGELYLTDVVAVAREAGRAVAAVVADDPSELEGVNDRAQLAAARRRLNDRLLAGHLAAGVDVADPATTWVDVGVRIEADAVLRPGTHLEGDTVVESGAEVGPDTTVVDGRVGAGARVLRSHVCGADVGARASVGPFSYLRPGTAVGEGAKVGAYVETKNASVGDGAKVPHLSYVGDATIGQGSNIGAGTIVANYDGVAKHHTVVGEHVRVGSDTVLVAPVTLGDGSYTAAGSVVTDDVPPGALVIARGHQHVSESWVTRRRAGTASAEAAERADARHNEIPQAAPGTPGGHDTITARSAATATGEGEGP